LTSPVLLHTVHIDPFLYYCSFAASRLLPLKAEKDIDERRFMECVPSVSDSRLPLLPHPASKALTETDFMVLRTRQICGGSRLVKREKNP